MYNKARCVFDIHNMGYQGPFPNPPFSEAPPSDLSNFGPRDNAYYDKYFWVSNTPVGKGAFDNQCVSPTCGHEGNATHGSTRDELGVNRSLQTTPIHCERCGELLPRPWVREADGRVRLMKGYTSAYKRMSGDLPASALT